MQKIIGLFQRNYDGDRLVRDEIVPGAEWVVAGEGVAFRKLDGTCCLVRDGKLYKRFDAKHGKTPPPDFEPTQDAPDANTGHWPGWVPVKDGPDDQWHRAAWDFEVALLGWSPPDGTYELVGPHINRNPEGFPQERLMPHQAYTAPLCPTSFEGLKRYLSIVPIEGIVWHHPDGRMVKIKAKDFGLRRQVFSAKEE